MLFRSKYRDPIRDLSTLQREGFKTRNIIYEFPRRGGYKEGNILNIKTEINDHIKNAKATKRAADKAIWIIWCIVIIQVFFFCVAIFHTMVTGKLLLSKHFSQTRKRLKLWPPLCRNIATYLSNSSSSIIMTIGVGGTFLGLILGLSKSMSSQVVGFNTGTLFSGLAISFTSSLSGVILAIFVRIAQQAFAGESETIETLTYEIKQLRSDVEGGIHKKVADATKTYFGDSFKAIGDCAAEIKGSAQELVSIKDSIQSCAVDIGKYKQTTLRAYDTFMGLAENSKYFSENIIEISGLVRNSGVALSTIGEIVEKLQKSVEGVGLAQDHYNEQLGASMALLDKDPAKYFEQVSIDLKKVNAQLFQLVDLATTESGKR